MRRLGILLGMVVALLAPCTASAASSGAIMNAVATSDWSHVNFNVSVNGGLCGTGYCNWYAVVLSQPVLPSYSCKREEFFDNDANTEVIWHSSPSQSTNASFEQSVTGVSLNPNFGGAPQLLCLEVIGTAYEAWAEENLTFAENLGGALPTVEVAPAAPAPQASVPPAAAPPATTSTPIISAACIKAEVAVELAGERVAHAKRAWRHAKGTSAASSKRRGWERLKREARKTERRQDELCG
jgi:hypothetical protein